MNILNEDHSRIRKGFEVNSQEVSQKEKRHVYLYRDIFEATGKPYPSKIDCPCCKEKDAAELRDEPYGYGAGPSGYVGYFCPKCQGVVYIHPNTLFLCHPGSFMTSLDVLKAQYQKFDKPAGEIVSEDPKVRPTAAFEEMLFNDAVWTLEKSKGRKLSDEEKSDILELISDHIEKLFGALDRDLEQI